MANHVCKRRGARLTFFDPSAKRQSKEVELRSAPLARMVEEEFNASLDPLSPDYRPEHDFKTRIERSFALADIALHAQSARRYRTAFRVPL